jgi:hypothetical protein
MKTSTFLGGILAIGLSCESARLRFISFVFTDRISVPRDCRPGFCFTWRLHGARHGNHILYKSRDQWHHHWRWGVFYCFLGRFHFRCCIATRCLEQRYARVHWINCKCLNYGWLGVNGLTFQIGSTPTEQGGWSGIVHGDDFSAGMPNHLMLLAWPTGVDNQIATSFRYSP